MRETCLAKLAGTDGFDGGELLPVDLHGRQRALDLAGQKKKKEKQKKGKGLNVFFFKSHFCCCCCSSLSFSVVLLLANLLADSSHGKERIASAALGLLHGQRVGLVEGITDGQCGALLTLLAHEEMAGLGVAAVVHLNKRKQLQQKKGKRRGEERERRRSKLVAQTKQRGKRL